MDTQTDLYATHCRESTQFCFYSYTLTYIGLTLSWSIRLIVRHQVLSYPSVHSLSMVIMFEVRWSKPDHSATIKLLRNDVIFTCSRWTDEYHTTDCSSSVSISPSSQIALAGISQCYKYKTAAIEPQTKLFHVLHSPQSTETIIEL